MRRDSVLFFRVKHAGTQFDVRSADEAELIEIARRMAGATGCDCCPPALREADVDSDHPEYNRDHVLRMAEREASTV